MGVRTNDGLRVLLPTDGSIAARAAEHWVANTRWASPPTIDVLTVAGSVANQAWTAGGDAASLAEPVAALAEREAAVAGQNADLIATRLRDGGFAAEATVRVGEPAVEILRTIDERRPDLVVLGNRGRSELDGPRLGSVSQQVVRHAAVPVLVGRPAGMPPGRLPQHLLLLAPTEGSAKASAEWLSHMGWLSGSRVTVLGLAGMPAGLAAGPLPPGGRLAAELDRRARSALGPTVQVLATGGADTRLEIATGHPLRMSLETAEALDVDLVVVAAESLIPGEYPLTEKLARYATRSVLVIPAA